MSKLKLFLILASALLISCANPNDPDNGNDTGTGGGNGGGGTGGGSGNPSWFLTADEQKSPWEIHQTLAVTLEGRAHYRITGILVTKKNTILAIYDNRKTSNADIGFANAANLEPLIRRSTDGGKNWSEAKPVGPIAQDKAQSHGDPVIFQALNGDIVVLAAAGGAWSTAPGNPSRISVIRSTDDGQTWGQWKDVQGTMFTSGKLYTAGYRKGFASSGRGTTLNDGTLACAVLLGDAAGTATKKGVAIFYSKDNGENWTVGGFASYNGLYDEPKISAELEDGKILLSARPNTAGQNRYWLVANNVDANPVKFADVTLMDANANAEGVRYTSNSLGHKKNRLLFLNAYSATRRTHLTIHLSEDEGKTYPVRKELNAGASCYSSIDVLGDGTIVTFAEETPTQSSGLVDRYDLVFRRFNLNWMTDGQQIYDEQY